MAVIIGVVAPVGAFTGGTATASPSVKEPVAYTCSGGNFETGTFTPIPSGTYTNITVTGACRPVPGAVINVVGSVNVAPHGVFDAQSFPSTITVGHNVTAGSGALLGLGCLPNPPGHTTGHPCVEVNGNGNPTNGRSNITVNGDILTWNADTVLLNGITVKGSVALYGGGGAIPWSIKTTTIGGNLFVGNVTPDWFGMIANNVGGNVVLVDIVITDTDPNPAIFVAGNTVGKNLACWGLAPAVSGGFGTEHNTVGGHSYGQCDGLKDE